MSDPKQIIRIFISSPGDVIEERDGAKHVVEGLRRLYPNVTLQPLLWEELALPATASFQETIDFLLEREPIDIAVFIVWSRLGSPLGPAITKSDGTPYRSGTEREFDLMLTAFERSGGERPVILAYVRDDYEGFTRRLGEIPEDQLSESIEQRKLVESFIQERFHDAEGRNLRAYQSYREPLGFTQRLRVHLRRAIDDLLDVDSVATWTEEPYRGLGFFDVQHAPIFHGREKETCDLLQRLRDQERTGCAFVVLVGASGSGKSSLALAGAAANLIEHAVENGGPEWRVSRLVPALAEQNLCEAIVRSLAEVLPELTESDGAANNLAEGLAENAALTVKLSVAPAFAHARQPIRLLLVIDQMEELWTDRRRTDADREQFLAAIEVLACSSCVTVLATLRSDFYHHAQASPIFLRLKGTLGQFDLLTPDAGPIHRLITEPARLAGLKFEHSEATGSSLDEAILQDASRDPTPLPLLEYTLSELYRQRDQNHHLLTYAAYNELGGVEGAIGKRAEETFVTLPSDAQAALKEVLPLLISVDVAGEQAAVCRRASVDDLTSTPARQTLTNRLIAERFLTTDREGHTPIACLAHEALLRSWDRIVFWVNTNREQLRIRGRVEQLQQRWRQQNRDNSLLLAEGVPLDEGRQLLKQASNLLSESTKDYINTSIAHLQHRARRTRRARTAILASIAALFVAMVGYKFYYDDRAQWDETKKTVELLADSSGSSTSRILGQLSRLPSPKLIPTLRSAYEKDADNPSTAILLALVRWDNLPASQLVARVENSSNLEVENFVDVMKHRREEAIEALEEKAREAEESENWKLKARLALLQLRLGEPSLAIGMLRTSPVSNPITEFRAVGPQSPYQAKPNTPKIHQAFQQANGKIYPHFAYCASMNWETFLEVLEAMRAESYRPTKIQPYRHGDSLHVAALWTRDKMKWDFHPSLSEAQLAVLDIGVSMPCDFAGYHRQGETRFCLLLVESENTSERRMRIARTLKDLRSFKDNNKSFSLISLHAFEDHTKRRKYAAVWEKDRQNATLFSVEPRFRDCIDASICLALPPEPREHFREWLSTLGGRKDLEHSQRFLFDRAQAYYNVAESAKALADIERLYSRNLRTTNIIKLRTLCLAATGAEQEALSTLELLEKRETHTYYYTSAIVSAYLGDPASTKVTLAALGNMRSDEDDLLAAICAASKSAEIFGAQGKTDAEYFKTLAFDLLTRLQETKQYRLSEVYEFLEVEPDVAVLHNDARGRKLLRKLGAYAQVRELSAAKIHRELRVTTSSLLSAVEKANECVEEGYHPVAIATGWLGTESETEVVSSLQWERPQKEFSQEPWTPEQRSQFVHEIGNWTGSLLELRKLVDGIEAPSHLWSGIFLTVGRAVDPAENEINAWAGLILDHAEHGKSGAEHAAANWLMNQWSVVAEPISFRSTPPTEKDWWYPAEGICMVRIRKGSFLYSNRTRITLSKDYWISTTEIPFRALAFVTGENDSWVQRLQENLRERPHEPAEVNWHQAALICNQLNERLDLRRRYHFRYKLGNRFEVGADDNLSGFRLPTYAEWIYACRAGSTYINSYGTEFRWIREFEVIWPEKHTKVASKSCNGWGLFDGYGNAEEWCVDFCTFDLGIPNASDVVDPVDLKFNTSRLAVGYRGYNLGDQEREAELKYQLLRNRHDADRTDSRDTCGIRLVYEDD